jgi:hypothetical protein
MIRNNLGFKEKGINIIQDYGVALAAIKLTVKFAALFAQIIFQYQ